MTDDLQKRLEELEREVQQNWDLLAEIQGMLIDAIERDDDKDTDRYSSLKSLPQENLSYLYVEVTRVMNAMLQEKDEELNRVVSILKLGVDCDECHLLEHQRKVSERREFIARRLERQLLDENFTRDDRYKEAGEEYDRIQAEQAIESEGK